MLNQIIINHPQGPVFLSDLEADVQAAYKRFNPNQYTFTTLTVDALIQKILELHAENETLKNRA